MTSAVTSNLASLTLSMQRATSPSLGGGDTGFSDARVKNALTALESLKRPASEAAEERKAAAAKKVEALKARIAMLRMGGGDPVATARAVAARAVAALARELSAAVKAYAAAGGGGSAAAGMSAVTAAPADTAAVTPPAEGSAAPVAVETEAEMEAGTRAEPPDDASAIPADPYRQVIERMQAEAADRARRNSSSEADARFAADVKGLAAELKAILREAQQRAKREGDPVNTSDEQAADKALSQVADAVSEVEPTVSLDGVMVGIGLSISV